MLRSTKSRRCCGEGRGLRLGLRLRVRVRVRLGLGLRLLLWLRSSIGCTCVDILPMLQALVATICASPSFAPLSPFARAGP